MTTKDSAKLKIYFDLDGVLADFRGYCDQHNIPYNPMNVRDKSVDKIMWDMIKAIPSFYYHLSPVEGSIPLFHAISQKYDCEILSAIPKASWGVPNTDLDKIRWCKKYLGEDVKVNIVYRDEKQNFAGSLNHVLVDDLDRNIVEWESQGGTGILFTDATSFDMQVLDDLQQRLSGG